MRQSTTQYFLYKVKEDGDWFRIFEPHEDGGSKIVDMFPGQQTTTWHGTIEFLRQQWCENKKDGWKDTAICKCGKEYDAGWYIHIGQCSSCETQEELWRYHEWEDEDNGRDALDE